MMLHNKLSFLRFRAIHIFLPFLAWLKTYNLQTLKLDALSGFTVAMVLIPQSMANAQLAGLPAYHGLYAAIFPVMVAGLWGSSRQMVTGTVAVVALMASAALEPLAISSPSGYIAYMAILTMLVGLVQLILGLFRLGVVVNFLSLPVIVGFTNASAIIIASSQFAKLLGVSVDSAGSQFETLHRVFLSAMNYTHLPSLFMALLALIIFLALKRFAPRVPAVLSVVVITTFVSWSVDFGATATVSIDAIKSDEAQLLLNRLSDREQEAAAIQQSIKRLETKEVTSQAGELARTFAIQQQRLLIEKNKQDVLLVREHLRRMLFWAVKQEDGSLLFYQKNTPNLVVLEDFFETNIPPKETFISLTTWRLVIGAKTPNFDSISIASGGKVIGHVPASLPYFSIPTLSWTNVFLLLPSALTIAFMGFAESVAIAKHTASITGNRLDPNQELIGQGLANIVGGIATTTPVSGSFSSSAVNLSSGAKTGLAGTFIALTTLVVLLFFTGALYHVPQPVLAVIILRALGSLFHLQEFRRVWTTKKQDGIIAGVTFVTTIYFAPHLDIGIGVGVVLSLANFFYTSMRPNVVSLSVGKDHLLHDVKAFGLEECRHIAIINFQGALFFGSAGVLEDYVLHRLEVQKDLRHIHLVCSGITQIDASGEDALAMVIEQAHKKGVDVSFSGLNAPVARVLGRSGIIDEVGLDRVFLTPREAICAMLKQIRHDANCSTCPLTSVFCRDGERDVLA